jgi:NADH:ubiquinone reductase (H+-translocating)
VRIVIVGGGFGGVKTALELSKRGHRHVTLISDQDYFLHHATLYATATGRSRKESVIKLTDIFTNHPGVTVVRDTVTALDTDRKLVVGNNKSYQYDSLVLALGVVTTYFGIQGLAEHSYGIKTLTEVDKFKKHLHAELEEDRHMDKAYIVIGAGPTGVELAGALTTYLKEVASAHKVEKAKINILLVEAAPRVLPRMSESASKVIEARLKAIGVQVLTGCKVESQDNDEIFVNGKSIPSETVVWTSGVTNNPFFKANANIFHIAPNGRVEVDEFLQAATDIYVIGDNANTRYTGTAYTALHNAKYIAAHLMRREHNKPLVTYQPHLFATTVPVGHNWAMYERNSRRFSGWLGAKIRRVIELNDYMNLLPFAKAWHAWREHHKHEEECVVCKKARA